MYLVEIAGDNDIAKKRRRQAIKSIKKAQYRQYTFSRLSKGVWRGKKKALKRVQIVNKNREVEKELQDRDSIEKAIAEHNKQHFKQAYSSKAYKDRIYNGLQCDNIRDKILRGELEIEDCDDRDVYSFLTLLKNHRGEEQSENSSEISEMEWERVVKKAKRKSVFDFLKSNV